MLNLVWDIDSYSCFKVQCIVNCVYNLIIQSISLMDQLDKDINTFSMKIRYIHISILSRCIHLESIAIQVSQSHHREWYLYYSLKLVKIVTDNYKVLKNVKSRKDLTAGMLEGLEKALMDSSKAQAVNW